MNFERKEKYDVQDLLHIMKILRSDQGCPWDREQTHQSIRGNFIEETYEAIEAIDKNDNVLLQEELGDVLLQVVFHSQMAQEEGAFDFSQVVDGICQKLIIRHPHIFADVQVNGSEEVLKNWDAIKKATKKQASHTQIMNDVPRVFPALMRSAKVQQKAARAGFDFENAEQTLDKVEEETVELRETIRQGDKQSQMDELGDLLFSVVNLSRFLKVDGEEALQKACDKFIHRFSLVEQMAANQHLDMTECSQAQLDALWEKAKSAGHSTANGCE